MFPTPLQYADGQCPSNPSCAQTTNQCYVCDDKLCTVSMWMLILLANACQLDDDFVVRDIRVSCPPTVNLNDCPLRGSVDASTTVTFSYAT
jgi:hypothetical protein